MHYLISTPAADAAAGARPAPRPPASLRRLLTAATAFQFGACVRPVCSALVPKKKTVINQRLGSASSPAARARMLHQQGAAAAAAAGVGGGLGPEQRHARPRPAHPRRRRLTRCCPPQPCRLRNCRRSRRLQVCPHLQSHEIARCLAPANAPS